MGNQNQTISARLWRAAKRWPTPNPQELAQLELGLARLEPKQCFSVLAEPFVEGSAQSERGNAQEYAGRLLLRLKPEPPYDAKETTRVLLSHWDVSVEQVPWYLETVLGEVGLRESLVELERDAEISGHVADSVRFWLRVPTNQRG